MEQERRDHEIALRLAAETGGAVEELHSLKRSSLVNAQRLVDCLKGTVNLISSDPQCKDDNAQFTTGPLTLTLIKY